MRRRGIPPRPSARAHTPKATAGPSPQSASGSAFRCPARPCGRSCGRPRCRFCRGSPECSIFYAAARHDIDPVVRFFKKLPQQLRTGQRILLLPGGEDRLTAQTDGVLHGRKRVARHIERAVQRHVHIARAVHQPPHCVQIQIAVRRQRADHNAVRAKLTVRPDLLAHLLQLLFAVKKISEAGTDQDIGLDWDIALHLPEQRRGRRGAADNKMRAQLQTVRAAAIRRPAGGVGIYAGFDQGCVHAGSSSDVSNRICAR